eukprot:COSAG01_NODE_4668_length_4830_cov_12.821542_3_plen_158_part_00
MAVLSRLLTTHAVRPSPVVGSVDSCRGEEAPRILGRASTWKQLWRRGGLAGGQGVECWVVHAAVQCASTAAYTTSTNSGASGHTRTSSTLVRRARPDFLDVRPLPSGGRSRSSSGSKASTLARRVRGLPLWRVAPAGSTPAVGFGAGMALLAPHPIL